MIDEETVNRLYDLYVNNLKKAREIKPIEELNKLVKKLGIEEA